MAITDSFRKAIAAGDVKDLHIMMKNSLLVDPSFAEFNEMNSLARSVNGLYEEHDGREMNTDKSTWNDDYMNKLMVQVVGNLSHERIEHLKEVVRYLRPIAVHQKQEAQKSGDGPRQRPMSEEPQHDRGRYQEPERPDQPYRRTTSDRGIKIVGGALGGGVVGAVVAGIIHGPIIVGALAGAVVAGSVVAIATRED